MTTYANIGLAEPSTITKVVASVVVPRGSTNEHQEILVIGDPDSSLGVARVVAVAPPSTSMALAVRLAGGPSSAVDCTIQIQGNSTVFQGGAPWTIGGNSSVRANLSSTAADNPVAISGNSTVVFQKASTSARASITQSSTSVTMQSSNTSRLGWSCFNNPTQNSNLYLKFGAATASTSDFDVRLTPFAYYEMPQPITTELIVGVWDSTGVGFARVREVLP